MENDEARLQSCPWSQESDDNVAADDDDDWFYSSIRDYEHLLMYSLEMTPETLRISPDGCNIAIAGRLGPVANARKAELCVYSLPGKLTARLKGRDAGLTSSRDFAFQVGTRSLCEAPQDVVFLNRSDPEVVSLAAVERESRTVSILAGAPSKDDILNCIATHRLPQGNSKSGCNCLAICLGDGSTSEKIFSYGGSQVHGIDCQSSASSLTKSSIICQEPSSPITSFCNGKCFKMAAYNDDLYLVHRNGGLSRADLRTKDSVVLHVDLNKIRPGTWSCDLLPASAGGQPYLGGIHRTSDATKLELFDLRKCTQPVVQHNLDLGTSSDGILIGPDLKGSANNNKALIVCKEYIQVYDKLCHDFDLAGQLEQLPSNSSLPEAEASPISSIQSELNQPCRPAFTHLGHRKEKSNKGELSILTAGLHNSVDNLVFSSDSQRNIQVWEFNMKKCGSMT